MGENDFFFRHDAQVADVGEHVHSRRQRDADDDGQWKISVEEKMAV